MNIERKHNTKYVCSLSYGKDSLAMLIKLCELGLPLDYVVYCDIRFNKDISGEHPLMSNWIPKANKILKEKFNIDVIVVTSPKTFTDKFYSVKTKGKHIGDIYGFPLSFASWCNSELKLTPLKKFMNNLLTNYDIVEYVGIAKDETTRLERYKQLSTENHSYITLADFNISEKQAMDICMQYNLLSPKYVKSFRSGCWFCPKQPLSSLYDLYINYPDYFNMLVEMQKDSHTKFNNTSIIDTKAKFDLGIVPKAHKKHVNSIKRSLI